MRFWVAVVGSILVACGDGVSDEPQFCGNGHPDISEECDALDSYTCSNCRLRFFDATVRWSFESKSTGVTSACLPGDPAVAIHTNSIQMGVVTTSAPCAGGAFTLPIKFGSTLWLTSLKDGIQYTGAVPGTVTGAGELPTAVIDTDVGGVGARWSLANIDGAPLTCQDLSVTTVMVIQVDDTRAGFYCQNTTGMQTGIVSPIIPGTHKVIVEFRDNTGLRASSMPMDVDVVTGTVAEVMVDFRL
jgi:hypothetical protein